MQKNKKNFSKKDRVPNKGRNRNSNDKTRNSKEQVKERSNEKPAKQLTCDLFGVHAVSEAILNPKRHIHDIFVTPQGEKLITPIIERSKAAGLQRPELIPLDKYELDNMLPDGAVHQGMAIRTQDLHTPSLDQFCRGLKKNNSIKDNIFVVLDQVTDTHNIGAILRSIAVFGGKAMIVQERYTPAMNGTLAKVASGAVEHVPVFREVNISRTLDLLQKHDILCVGLDERGHMQLSDVTADESLSSYSGVALVMGAEGEGMRRLTAEHCDILVRLPSSEAIKSLNVSNAAAVALYELVR